MQQGQSKHNGSGKMGSGAERDSKGKGRRQHDRAALAAHAVPSAGLPLGSGVAPAGRGGRGGRGGIRAGGRVQVYSKTQGVWCDGRCAYTDHSRVEMPEIADLGMIACVPSGFCGWSIPSPPKVRPLPTALSGPARAQLTLFCCCWQWRIPCRKGAASAARSGRSCCGWIPQTCGPSPEPAPAGEARAAVALLLCAAAFFEKALLFRTQ